MSQKSQTGTKRWQQTWLELYFAGAFTTLYCFQPLPVLEDAFFEKITTNTSMKTKHDSTYEPATSMKQKSTRLARHTFTEEEDEQILEGVERYQYEDGNPNWVRITKHVSPKLHIKQVIQVRRFQ